jgi:hypothetical protein
MSDLYRHQRHANGFPPIREITPPRQSVHTPMAFLAPGAGITKTLREVAHVTLPGGQLWAIEIKRSSVPTLEKGFHFACADLKPKQRFVVYPGHECFSLDSVTEAIGLRKLAHVLQAVR